MTESRDNCATEPAANTIEMAAAERRSQTEKAPAGDAAAQAPPKIPLAPIKILQAKFNPLADAMLYLVVFAGGCVGTGLRYGLALLIAQPAASSGPLHGFHTSTFVANMVSTFVFAILAAYLSQAAWIRKRTRELTSHGVGMGLCGGLSTLSTLAIEDLAAAHSGEMGGFVFYMAVTFVCGFILAWFGARIGLMAAQKRDRGIADDAESVLKVRARRHDSGGDAAVSPGADAAADMPGGHKVGMTPDANGTVEGAQMEPSKDRPASSAQPPRFEPAPITDEIRLVPDPVTGEVR